MSQIKEKIAEKTEKNEIDSLVNELESVRSDFPTRYYRYMESVKSRTDYISFFNKTTTPVWIANHKKQIPALSEIAKNPQYNDYFNRTSIDGFSIAISMERERLALERAKLNSQLNSFRKTVANILFSDSQLLPIKERYERILKCEEGSLD